MNGVVVDYIDVVWYLNLICIIGRNCNGGSSFVSWLYIFFVIFGSMEDDCFIMYFIGECRMG